MPSSLPHKTLDGEITSVAEVADPAGWWTGNVVKYDTIIELPLAPGLKPGMSADVEVTIDRHEDVLTVPVNAVLQTEEGTFCWSRPPTGQCNAVRYNSVTPMVNPRWSRRDCRKAMKSGSIP